MKLRCFVKKGFSLDIRNLGELMMRTISYIFIGLVLPVFIYGCLGDDPIIQLPKTDDGDKTGTIEGTPKATTLMVAIPAGEFLMGALNGHNGSEKPEHTVYLDAYKMDEHEVTNSQYAEFLNAYKKKNNLDNQDRSGSVFLNLKDSFIEYKDGKYSAKSGWEDSPVVQVTWLGANTYAEFYNLSLPTEAQWEKAARSGLQRFKYPWGSDNITHDNANYRKSEGKDIWLQCSPVKMFAPNGYGLYDMAGNAWEWCSDWYEADYYEISPKNNPTDLKQVA